MWWFHRGAALGLDGPKRPLWQVVDSWLPPLQTQGVRGDLLRL